MSLTTCPPASCLSSFAVEIGNGRYTLRIPNFQQCTLDDEPCNSPLTAFTSVFTRADLYYRAESEENPQCSYVTCTYTTDTDQDLVLSTLYSDGSSHSTAYIPAVPRTDGWELGFLHSACNASVQGLECQCPMYRMHGVQVAWDNQGCCCNADFDSSCFMLFGPSLKYSSLCESSDQCTYFNPPPSPIPVPELPCPPPPSVIKKGTTCPPSSLIRYGNDGWFVSGDVSVAYQCDPDHSNGCIVDGVVLASGVRFSQLVFVINDGVVEYIGCTYQVAVERVGAQYVVEYVTMNVKNTAVYHPISAVMYAPGGSASVLACDVAVDDYIADVCTCPFERNHYVEQEQWDDCCCEGVSTPSCYMSGLSCPIVTPAPPHSAGASLATCMVHITAALALLAQL